MARREARCENCNHIAQYEGRLNQEVDCVECDANVRMTRKNSRPLYGWRVVRDYGFDATTDEPEYNRQGKEYGDYQGGKHRYRLRDDDGNACYLIESDTAPDSDKQSRLFAPLEWAMNDVGATSIEYKTTEGWEYL